MSYTYTNDFMTIEQLRSLYIEKQRRTSDIREKAPVKKTRTEKENPVKKNPTDPTVKPSSPKAVLMEATMEIVVKTYDITVPCKKPVSLLSIMEKEKEKEKSKSPTETSISMNGSKGKTRKMGLGEFFEEVKRDEEVKASKQKQREARKLARARKRDKGFTEVKSEKSKVAKISKPDKKQITANKRLVPPTPKSRFVNTTLILKNLPYQGVTSKDLRRFFEKNAGPTKFVNLLTKPNGTGKGIAFIRFETRQGSDSGVLMNRFLYEGRTVYVEYADDKREK